MTAVLYTHTFINNNPEMLEVTLKGQVDESNLAAVMAFMDPLIDTPATRYVFLNFKDLEFINSKVIGYLASLYTRSVEKGFKVMIVEFNPTIFDILSLVGLDNVFTLYSTLNEALEAVNAEAESNGETSKIIDINEVRAAKEKEAKEQGDMPMAA